jgi:hypothetical protein
MDERDKTDPEIQESLKETSRVPLFCRVVSNSTAHEGDGTNMQVYFRG